MVSAMRDDRPFLATIEQRATGSRAAVTVTVGRGDESFEGSSEGNADPGQRARLVGEATLRAVEALSANPVHYELTAVATTDLGPVRVALAQVREDGWSDYLIGTSLVRDGDSAAATAKAVLDALNRRIAIG